MSPLPLTQIVLHKHGVGYFVRQGQHDGPHLALSFPAEDLNDILKSLTIIDQAEGERVLGMRYPTPMNEAERLRGSRFQLSPEATLLRLLQDLRGRRVSVTVTGEDGESEAVIGRVVGVDDAPRNLLTLRTTDGALRMLDIAQLSGLILQEDTIAQDLLYFLDTLAGDEQHRTLNVRLTGGKHDLRVSYVAPSPTWRVSYRVVAEPNAERSGGQCLLQGWGIFDNRLDEDLQDVRVTLVAGQPISFIYDLADSAIPQRPLVKDETRVVPGPVMFESANPPPARQSKARMRPALGAIGASADGIMPQMEAPAPATTTARGEFFQYEVTQPVSVKRGESALVPILSRTMEYGRELLYNGSKLPDHPVAALRLKNSTGLTVEHGPVTLMEGEQYLGEAVIPYTRPGETVYMPYAVELGVKVVERQSTTTQTHGLSLQDELLIHEQYHIQIRRYIVQNKTEKPLKITIEAPIDHAYTLFDTREPHIETATERRWEVEFPAETKSEFIVQQRQVMHESLQIRHLDYRQLETLYKDGWLAAPLYQGMWDILDSLAEVAHLREQQAGLDDARQALYDKQANLRENLGALGSTADAADLRARLLSRLTSAQDQLDDLDAQEQDLAGRIEMMQQSITEMIATLGQPPAGPPPPPEDA